MNVRGIRLHRWIGFSAGRRKRLPLNLGRMTHLTLGIVSFEWGESSNDSGATAVAQWRKEARRHD